MISQLIHDLAPLYTPFLQGGFKIYLVGGAVRDLVLGKQPKDFDFTTDARPQQVQQLFRRTLPTGIKHGTVTVMIKNQGYEVTTFRTEGDYKDHRKPETLEFTASLEEDLCRRDFTINALAMELPTGEIHDFHGGRQDLKDQIIRAIGTPRERFQEDALRILRACRFAARLGFTIHGPTWEAIKELKQDLRWLSRERVREELTKLLDSPRPGYGVQLLADAGILEQLQIPLEPPLAQRLSEVLTRHPALVPASRWALLLWNHPERELWLKKMTFSNQEIKDIEQRVRWGEFFRSLPPLVLGEALFLWGQRDLQDAFLFLNGAVNLGYLVAPTKELESWESEARAKLDRGDPLFIGDLAVQGTDLMAALAQKGGPWLGALLHRLLRHVWVHPEENEKDALLALGVSWGREGITTENR